jgi:hypothetical protein
LNGKYHVHYRLASNPDIGGTAVVSLSDGKIKGSDAGFDYSGSYAVVGGHLNGKLLVVRQRELLSIFGDIAEIRLDLKGTIQSGSIEVSACNEEARTHMVFATLTPVEVN